MSMLLAEPHLSLSKKNSIYESLRKAIISGEFRGGAILNEGELAARYQVSRTPVREALLMLTFEGLLTGLPRAGYLVTSLTVTDVLEAFHLREVLEVEAVGLAVGRVSSADLDELERTKVGIPAELNSEYNRIFHLTIARASGNQRLARLIGQILDEMDRIMEYDPFLSDPPSADEHEIIIEALRNEQVTTAQSAMRQHVRGARDRVLKRF